MALVSEGLADASNNSDVSCIEAIGKATKVRVKEQAAFGSMRSTGADCKPTSDILIGAGVEWPESVETIVAAAEGDRENDRVVPTLSRCIVGERCRHGERSTGGERALEEPAAVDE